jgi:small subunit ribosomal protein S20
MRNSARKQLHNRSIKTRLHTVEKNFLELIGTGKKEDAAKAFVAVSSALDKAAKSGNIHKSRASRKKSRLAVHLNKMK